MGGDWICDACNNINFPDKEACNKCAKPKLSRKFPGSSWRFDQKTFQWQNDKKVWLGEGDWICDSCSNINFSDKEACNKCAQPKPAFDQFAGKLPGSSSQRGQKTFQWQNDKKVYLGDG